MARLLFLGIVGIALIFGGCGEKLEKYKFSSIDANVSLSTDEEIGLANRFLKYWDARSRKDFETSYQMELPYNRYLKTYNMYEAEGQSIFENFHTVLLSVRFDKDEKNIAWIQRKYIHKDTVLLLNSKWINVHGTWYHKYTFSVFPE